MIQVAPAPTKTYDNLSHIELWNAYWENGEAAINELLEAYLPLAHRILERISIRLPSHVAVEDLSQVSLLGLYKAITSFEPHRGIPFEGYAYPRVRGAILDELRSNDFLSRHKRSQMERIEEVISQWLQRHGEMPNEDIIAQEMNITIAELNSIIDLAKPWCSLDAVDDDHAQLYECLADPNAGASSDNAQKRDVRRVLREAFRQLEMREQKILYLYYFEELRLSEIASLYGISEARISQIRALSMLRLRAAMRNYQMQDFV